MKLVFPIILAVIVGLLSIAPYLYAYWFVEPFPTEVEKLHFFYQDSELRYMSRIREIIEGNWPAASPVFYEYKDSAQAQQPFGEGLYAISTLGNTDLLPTVVLLSKFFLPALLFILVYFLCRRLVISSLNLSYVATASLSAFIAFLVAQGLGAHRLGPFLELLTVSASAPELSKWTRIVNPIFGGLTLFATLLLVATSKKNNFSWLRALTTGVLVGVSSAYFFSFVLAVLLLTLWGAFLLLYREWSRLWELVLAGFVVLVINFKYFTNILSGGTESAVSLEKNGLFFTHEPLLNYGITVAGVVFIAAVFLERRQSSWKGIFSKTWWRFGAITIMGSLAAYNIQVLTGVTVWPGHFTQYTDHLSLIIIWISIVLIGSYLYQTISKVGASKSRVNSTVIIIAPLAIGLLTALQIASVASVHTWSSKYENAQQHVPVFEWLSSRHPNGGCVVFMLESENNMSDYFTAYTPCDVYHSHFVFMALPEERIMHNYIAYLRLRGITSNTIDEYLETNQRQWQDLFFSDWREKFAQSNNRWLAEVERPGQVVTYLNKTPIKIKSAFLASLETPLEEWLQRYKLDYIIFNKKLSVSVTLPESYKQVYEDDTNVIYSSNE